MHNNYRGKLFNQKIAMKRSPPWSIGGELRSSLPRIRGFVTSTLVVQSRGIYVSISVDCEA